MPPEWHDTKALVHCNDCSAKTAVTYHFLGLKCDVCESYNTIQLQILGTNPLSPTLDPTALQGEPDATSEPEISIPNRPGTAISDLADRTSSSWVISPERAARSVSPVVGNYFGIQRRNTNALRHADSDDDEEPWFWGIESPLRGIGRFWEDRTRSASGDDKGDKEEEGTSDESDEDDDIGMEIDLDDDDDEDEDQMELPGHR